MEAIEPASGSVTGHRIIMRTVISIVVASTVLLAACACGGSRSTTAGAGVTGPPVGTVATTDAGPSGPAHQAVYEVTSDAPIALAVSWRSWREGGSLGAQEFASRPALPLRRSLPLPDGAGDLSFALEAQAAQGATTITCRILVDGVVRAERSSTGEFSVANCYVR